MKSMHLVVTCDVAGCDAQGTSDAITRTAALNGLSRYGWRFGATRDVCPSCRDKGHRP